MSAKAHGTPAQVTLRVCAHMSPLIIPRGLLLKWLPKPLTLITFLGALQCDLHGAEWESYAWCCLHSKHIFMVFEFSDVIIQCENFSKFNTTGFLGDQNEFSQVRLDQAGSLSSFGWHSWDLLRFEFSCQRTEWISSIRGLCMLVSCVNFLLVELVTGFLTVNTFIQSCSWMNWPPRATTFAS